MHELSIAADIIDIAEEFVRDHRANKIIRLELEAGLLSGIVPESLEFALNIAVKNTVLEKTEIILSEVAGRSKCNKCQTIFEVDDWFTPCPACGSMDLEMTGGKELIIKSIITDG